MFLKFCVFLGSFLSMSYVEYYSSHLDWKPVSLIHHLIVASTSNYLLYSDPQKIFHMTEYNSTDFSPIYNYIPIISCAYGYFDLYHAISDKKSFDFVFHGIFFVGTTSWAQYNNVTHWLYPGLLIETSSIFLTTIHKHPLIKYMFCASFILYRNILLPYISAYWFYHNSNLYEPIMNNEKMVASFLIMINSLNFFWGYKVIRKLMKHLKQE